MLSGIEKMTMLSGFSGCSSEPNARWFAVQTLYRHEKSVFRQLSEDGRESFVPTYRELRKWSDRQKVIETPLFPGYVFVRLGDLPSERVEVLRKPGVMSFVGNRQENSAIPDAEIENLKHLVRSGVPYTPCSYLKVGQRVRVRDGALRGLEGILVRVANEDTVVLSVDLVQRSVMVRIQGYSLDVCKAE